MSSAARSHYNQPRSYYEGRAEERKKEQEAAAAKAAADKAAAEKAAKEAAKAKEFTGLSTGVSDLLKSVSSPMSNVLRDYSDQTIAMGKSFIQGQLQAASQHAYSERQKILDVQRRYGITGAVANAQLQDLELKQRAVMSEISNKAAMQWYQTVGSVNMKNVQVAQMEKSKNVQAIIKQIVDNKVGSVDEVKNLFSAVNMNVADLGLGDDDLENMLGKKEALNTWFNTNKNKYEGL